MPRDGVVCVNCGFNAATGERVSTSTESGEREDERPAAPLRAFLFVANLLPGLFRIKVLILSVVVGVAGWGVLGLALFFMQLGTWISAFAIGAVGVIIYAQAIAWLVDGELSLLSNALTEFDGIRWAIFFTLLAAPLVAFFLLLRALLQGS
jgi:hypothetical protein